MPLFKGGDIFISAFILPTNGGTVYCSEVAMLESYSQCLLYYFAADIYLVICQPRVLLTDWIPCS